MKKGEDKNLKNGFLFFYDWAEPFKNLSGEDFKTLFFAMMEYQKNGTKPGNFEGESAMIAAFVFPQLDRRRSTSEAGKKGMARRWGEKNELVNNKTITLRQRQDKDKDKDKDRDKDKDKDTHSYAHKARSLESCAFPSEKVKEMFDLFFGKYPKHNCRVRAEKAFIDLAPSEELFEDIMFALDVQLNTGKFSIDEPRYIPTAARWLSEKRWTDKIDGEELLRHLCNEMRENHKQRNF